MALNGWPFNNAAADARNFTSPAGLASRQAWVVPRPKWGFLVEFNINSFAQRSNFAQTNLAQYVSNGKLFLSLKSIDLPKVSIKTERIRSYNKDKLVPVRQEYPPCSMTFHDDATSMVAALMKEYLAFYSETGDIGGSTSLLRENQKLSTIDSLLEIDAMRAEMNSRPSLGLRLRNSDMRHYFENIIVYNFGPEPDSINTYYYYHPVITQIEHEAMDYEDRSGKPTVTFSFEYEGFYFSLGQPRDQSKAHPLTTFNPNAEVVVSTSQSHALMNTRQQGGIGDVPTSVWNNPDGWKNPDASTWVNPDGWVNPDAPSGSPDTSFVQARQPGESIDAYNSRMDAIGVPAFLRDASPSTSGSPIEVTGLPPIAAPVDSQPLDQPGSALPETQDGTAQAASDALQQSLRDEELSRLIQAQDLDTATIDAASNSLRFLM